MVTDRGIFKNNRTTLFACFIHQQRCDHKLPRSLSLPRSLTPWESKGELEKSRTSNKRRGGLIATRNYDGNKEYTADNFKIPVRNVRTPDPAVAALLRVRGSVGAKEERKLVVAPQV